MKRKESELKPTVLFMSGSAPIPGSVPGASTNGPVLPPMALPMPPSKTTKTILTKYRPTKQMRSLYWTVVPERELKGTMFEDVKINEDEIYLDFQALEQLAQNKKFKKVKKNKDNESVIEHKKEFVSDIIMSTTIRSVVLVLFKYNAIKIDDAINDIVNNLLNIKDVEYLEKLTKIVPSQDDMEKFKNHPKILKLNSMSKKEDRQRVISKFPLMEQFWYFCMEIPYVYKRCKSQLFRLEMDEFITLQYEILKLAQNLCNTLKNNAKMSEIDALILGIGNFLNHGHSALGKVDGFTLDTFDKLKISRSNQDNRYSLLIYLVEMVNANYPELSDWVNIFDPFQSIHLIYFNAMRSDINYKRQRLTEFVNNITRNRDDDEFFKYIYKWSVEMTSTINELATKCDDIMTKCQELKAHIGYNGIDDDENLFGLGNMLRNIQRDWNQSQKVIDRAKNIFITLICGYIREYEYQYNQHIIPPGVIWIIYIFFPKWNLLSISKYLDFSEYELNQYKSISNRLPVRLISADIDLSMIRSSTQRIKPIPSKKMKLLQWNRIANINDTIFKYIKDNENKFRVCIDFEMLDKLWCDRKRQKPMIKKTKNNMFAVYESSQSPFGRRVIGIVLFKGNPKGLRDAILNIDNINIDNINIEYLQKIMRIIPNEEEMDKFKKNEKVLKIKDVKDVDNKNVDNIISKWALTEQLWYHCINIKYLNIRCQLKLLQFKVDELETFNYEIFNLLQNIFNGLYNNDQIKKIAELVLFIGNYLNFGKRSISNCRGFRVFETVQKLKDYKSKFVTDYSLFMYLVETVNQNYPELAHWVDAFSDVEKCKRIGFEQIKHQNDIIQTQINGFKSRLDEFESKHDDIDKMTNKLNDIDVKMDRMNDEYEEIVAKCELLMNYFIYSDTMKPGKNRFIPSVFMNFSQLLTEIYTKWNTLQVNFDKIRAFIIAYCRKYGKTEEYSLEMMPNEVITRIYMYFPKLFEMKDLIKKYHGTNINYIFTNYVMRGSRQTLNIL